MISCSKGSSQPAGLLLVEFFPTPGVAHEPEAAGGVDLQAGPDAAEKGLAGGGPHLTGVECQSAFGAGVGLREQGALAEDLAAGQRQVPAAEFQAPAPAVEFLAVGHGPGMGHGEVNGGDAWEEHMPAARRKHEPSAAFIVVAGAEVVGAVEDAPGKAGFHTVHVNSCLRISSSW